ncbi:hypothetical protein ALC56_15168 [Trachymyrmex septentrionalis]|uniref:Uncharacterized protein n=1 Tax=Trachymyrmex septentrionalis TaxID=34720 RepID=A0A195ERE3_9HYME|nr:hypothetical protein ALC56_15168 [Trachymyrmex septentrionalis]
MDRLGDSEMSRPTTLNGRRMRTLPQLDRRTMHPGRRMLTLAITRFNAGMDGFSALLSVSEPPIVATVVELPFIRGSLAKKRSHIPNAETFPNFSSSIEYLTGSILGCSGLIYRRGVPSEFAAYHHLAAERRVARVRWSIAYSDANAMQGQLQNVRGVAS